MKNTTENYIHKYYIDELAAKTVKTGRVVSFAGLPLIILLYLQDVYLLNMTGTFAWGAVCFFSVFLFLIFTYTRYVNRTKLLFIFYSLAISGAIIMMCGLTWLIFVQGAYPETYKYGLALGFSAVIFVVFLISAGALKYLIYSILVPLAVFLIYLTFLGLPLDDWIALSIVITFAVTIGLFSLVKERRDFEDYKIRKQLVYQDIELKKEIKERKLAEQELKKNAEMLSVLNNKLQQAQSNAEESDRLKTAFLGNVSHEMRNPVNNIIGFVEILNDAEMVFTERKGYHEIIHNLCYELLTVFDELLDFSVIESGNVKIIPAPCCLNTFLDEIHRVFVEKNKLNQNPGLKFYLHKPLNSDLACFFCDKEIMKKAVVPLVDNAFKYTCQGFVELGYLLKEKNIRQKDLTEVILYVKDTGSGIDEDKQELVFEKFRQADESSTKRFGGTGLGLSIAQGYVELMGGQIRLESKPGQGTSVMMILPMEKVE